MISVTTLAAQARKTRFRKYANMCALRNGQKMRKMKDERSHFQLELKICTNTSTLE